MVVHACVCVVGILRRADVADVCSVDIFRGVVTGMWCWYGMVVHVCVLLVF